MSVPLWTLLGFAVWTLLTLFGSVGVYRWSRILTRRASISEWRPDEQQGNDWYRRATRAHMNCVENLPVYTAIVVAVFATGAKSELIDGLAITVVVARVCQTLVHIAVTQTDSVVSFRFAFFFLQAVCMLAMAVLVAMNAIG